MSCDPAPSPTSRPIQPASTLRYACDVTIGLAIAAIVLHCWLLQGMIWPVMISGGSMAQAYQGPRRQIECPRCGFDFACGLEYLPESGTTCPNCGQQKIDFTGTPFRFGDQFLIDRTSDWIAPRRWEAVVLQCPGRQRELCVKRVVGLPGESVQLRGGDVFINGKIAGKGLRDVRRMALLVHDDTHRADDENPRWRGDSAESRWRRVEDGYVLEALDISPVDWLSYHHLDGQPIRDVYSYNQNLTRATTAVADVGLACWLQAEGAGALHLRYGGSQAVLSVSANGELTLEVAGRPASRRRIDFNLARPAAIEWWHLDGRLLLAVNGDALLEHPLDLSAGGKPGNRPLAIGGSKIHLRVQRLRVWRDVHYGKPVGAGKLLGLSNPCQLGSHEFFLLGDNSPISQDSRVFGPVHRNQFVGRPWPR